MPHPQHPATPPTTHTTQTRLHHHQCVWCGTTLTYLHPDNTYCGSDHQSAWHTWTNGHPLEADTRRPSLITLMEHERYTLTHINN